MVLWFGAHPVHPDQTHDFEFCPVSMLSLGTRQLLYTPWGQWRVYLRGDL